jgi:hypothetical protein
MHTGGGGEWVFKKLDFLTTPNTPSKEFGQNPKDPFPHEFPTTVYLWKEIFFLTEKNTDRQLCKFCKPD